MEMMDIRAAIQWLNESSDLMVVMSKSLESQPKGESDFLKRELITVQRAFIETALKTSLVAAIAISDQMILEQPLLVGHSEDYSALVKAQARYREESNKACSVLKKTAPVNQTAPADAQAPESSTPVDRQKRIEKRFEELRAKSSPPAVNPAIPASKADGIPSETPADAAHIIIEGNVDQSTKRSD
jgi:hypothetical protein